MMETARRWKKAARKEHLLYKTSVLNARPAINKHLSEASRVMSAAVSVRLESTSSLVDVLAARDPEIRCVDGSVYQKAYLGQSCNHSWILAYYHNR